MRTIKTWLAAIAVLLCSITANAVTYSDWTSTNQGQSSSTSSNTYTITASAGDVLTFDWLVSSESNYDKLIITIGGTEILNNSGELSGTYQHTFTSSGTYTMVVKYTKDGSADRGSDYAKVYNISMNTGNNSGDSNNENIVASGTCGTSLTWELTNEGELIIEGNGTMTSHPWRNNHKSDIKTVIIGEGVTSIDDYAFEDCTGLTSITIPEGVTSIGWDAFSGCTGLTSVTIPNSVTSIGSSAFFGCTGLASITIPESVTNIAGSIFSGCNNLTSIIVEEGNLVYDSRENCSAIIETETNELISGCQSTIIPNSVTRIGSSAFYGCTGLTSVTIPNSVTRIGGQAFDSCSGLTSVTIPISVTSIGEMAFDSCSGLTSVTIGNSVTIIGYGAFRDCTELLDVYCYAENVPSTENNTSTEYNIFGGSCPIANATLHVPAPSLESYKSTSPWSSFSNIVALPQEVSLEDGVEYENNTEADMSKITYTRTLSKTNTWNALYVPFEIPMTEEFLEDYDVAYFNDIHSFDNYIGDKENNVLGQDGVIDGMEMEVLKVHEGDVLNANYPYLIRAKNTDALNMNIVVEDATLYQAKETTISCSSVFMRFDVTGIYTTQTAGELKGEFDVYAMSGGGWKQALNPSQQLKPFRLYLSLSTIDGSPVKVSESAMSRINIRVQGEDTETSILETESGEAEIDIFDLSGRRVQNTQKGLYIVNGKKVIVK